MVSIKDACLNLSTNNPNVSHSPTQNNLNSPNNDGWTHQAEKRNRSSSSEPSSPTQNTNRHKKLFISRNRFDVLSQNETIEVDTITPNPDPDVSSPEANTSQFLQLFVFIKQQNKNIQFASTVQRVKTCATGFRECSTTTAILLTRISKDRYCIYLSKKELVDQLIHNNQHITVDDQIIKLRRLHNPDKRIIISNVFPNIPNSPILEQLSEHNIIPTSPISFLRAGSIANGLDHVLRFRRQVFISHDDIEKLPKSMLINQDSSYYRIFLADDKVTCFMCKEKGHTSTVCPMNTDKSFPTDTICETLMDLDTETNKHTLSPTTNQSPLTAVPNEKITVSGSCTDKPDGKDKPTTLDLTILQNASEEISLSGGIKRPAPPTLSSSSSPPQSPTIHINPPTAIKSKQVCDKKTEENTTMLTQKTKLKSSTDHFIDTMDDHISPCKSVFNVTKEIPINYEQFKLLLVNCINSNNPHENSYLSISAQ
ncbi:hypothetical protein ACI65C_002582 [Semiaphis heraclei]